MRNRIEDRSGGAETAYETRVQGLYAFPPFQTMLNVRGGPGGRPAWKANNVHPQSTGGADAPRRLRAEHGA